MISILSSLSVATAFISKLEISSFIPTVYEWIVFLKFGLIVWPLIDRLDNPNFESVVAAVSDAFLVIVIVYVFFVPSCAITSTFASFAPSFNSMSPVPVTWAFESVASA